MQKAMNFKFCNWFAGHPNNHGGIWPAGDRGTCPAHYTSASGPLTGIESMIPGWDAFNPLTGTNFVRQSVSDKKLLAFSTNNNHAALLAIFSVLTEW